MGYHTTSLDQDMDILLCIKLREEKAPDVMLTVEYSRILHQGH